MTQPTNDTPAPLQWICLQLIPLEGKDMSDPDAITVWWNPDEQTLFGDSKTLVMDLIQKAQSSGLETMQGAFEITEPLGKPSQLAAILAQKYWVVPQPVENPGDLPESA